MLREASVNNTTTPSKATSREWIGLAVIALPCMLYSMDLTVLNLAVPQLTADLKPTAAQLLWIIDIYGFMVAGFLMTMGTLGDRIGRRKLLLIGAAAFGLTSILAAFSTSPEMLIFARAVLGISGATLAPSTLSLISNMFPDQRERTFAIGIWISSFSAGAIIGPLAGGFLIQYFWWGSVFLAGVPVMLLLLAVAPWLLPEYRDPKAGRIDLASAGLSLIAVLAIIYGMKRLAEAGFEWSPVVIIMIGLALTAVFIRRQTTLADPLLDLRLFRAPAFTASIIINVTGMFFMFGSFIFMAQYFQLVAGLSPLAAGLWSVPSAIAFTAASMLTPALAERMRPAYLMAGGMVLSAAGFIMLALAESLIGVVAASIVFSVGFTPVISLTTGLIVGAAPPERAGAASALSETAAELGGALGIAVLGSIGAAIYRSWMAHSVPNSLPPELARAARATLGGAVEAAMQLPESAAAGLLATARGAFNSGFQASAVLAAIFMTAAALLTILVLRQLPQAPQGGHS
jgi:MFS transporter, DHA2 family, multidrug resistance protein